MSLRTVLGVNLRALRAERGWTQEDLAGAAGLARNYVGMLEREENAATVDALEKLAAALGVPAPRLIEKPSKRSRS
jgi:transcriptional regulator with XRE-family HTH domain